MSKKSANGHWKNPQRIKLDPEESFGFVYLIVNLLTGHRYIGKKQYHQYKKRVRHRPSDWKGYTSSSKSLNADISSMGMSNFHFEILIEFQSRSGLTYGETHLQHIADVLTERDKNGERVFYNAFIDKIRFIPGEFMVKEAKQKVLKRVNKDFT